MDTYQRCKENARQKAIDWQRQSAEQSLSYSELAAYGDYFTKRGRRYGLLREFRENAII